MHLYVYKVLAVARVCTYIRRYNISYDNDDVVTTYVYSI